MIKDELEYEVSKEWVEKFNKTIAAMERDEEAKRRTFSDGNPVEVSYNAIWISYMKK
jgi:hypothetical protein